MPFPRLHPHLVRSVLGLLHLLDRGVGQNVDIGVVVDLVHLRGFDADRAVVGREGLVETGHHDADARGVVYEVDLAAILGGSESGVDAGYPCAND